MQSLRRFLFRSDTVSFMFVAQAVVDSLIIVLIVNYLVSNQHVQLRHGAEALTLVGWSFVTLWAIAILIVSLIFGISVVNRVIFYKQIVLGIVIYAAFQVILFGFGGTGLLTWTGILYLFVFTTVGILLFRTLLFISYKLFSKFNRGQRVIIIGCNAKAEMLHRGFLRSNTDLDFLGFFDQFDPESNYFTSDFKGYLEQVKSFCIENRVSGIYYTLANNKAYLDDLSDFADQNFIFLGIVPDVELKARKKLDTAYMEDMDIPIITYRYSPLQKRVNYMVKRVFDIFFSAAFILFAGPVLLPAIALAITLDSPGPVFFVQKRPGRSTRLFKCYKFRTMRVNGETEKQATRSDSRITRVGAFLRKTSLDELPQFFNVLKGDMSIVGPRPNLITHLDTYSRRTPDYSLRHIVTPGITGYAQISGYRGETSDHGAMEKRVEYDMKYMLNWSFLMDLKIIAKTVVYMLRGDEKAY